jgi:hypothetical protein
MEKDTFLFIDVSEVLKTVKDKLTVLYIYDVFPDLVFELAMNCWNVKYFGEQSDESFYIIVKNKIVRYFQLDRNEMEELIQLIVSAIKIILSEIGDKIRSIISEEIDYVDFEKLDINNHLFIRVQFKNEDE